MKSGITLRPDRYGSILKSLGLWFIALGALLLNITLSLGIFSLNGMIEDFSLVLSISLLLAIAGSILALLISGVIARFIVGVRPIFEPASYLERWLVTTVRKQSHQLGIQAPAVGIFYSSDMNAFTTGWGERHALLAVSTGLLENLKHDELEAVIGHELAHIENGDMVAMALVQGISLVFVHAPCWLASNLVDHLLLRGKSHDLSYQVTRVIMLASAALLPSMIISWFSRYREYHADATSALLHGKEKMIAALEALRFGIKYSVLPENIATLGISGEDPDNIRSILMSHPSLSQRIQSLEQQF